MTPVKVFSKIFDLERGQMLIVKEYESEDEKNVIRVSSCFEDEDCSVSPSAILGYDSMEKRDKAFDKFNYDMADKLFQDFEQMLKD